MEELFIESLDSDGCGIVRMQGRDMRVRGALSGERVSITPSRRRGRCVREVSRVIESSPDRVEPLCAMFGTCGGCRLQHLSPQAQIALKQAKLMTMLAANGACPAEAAVPIEGPSFHYRRRARLAAKFVANKGGVLVGFRECDARFVADMDECGILDARLSALIRPLRAMIGGLSIRGRMPQIEATAADECVALTLRCLDRPHAADRDVMAAFAHEHDVEIFLQEAGPDTVEPLNPDGTCELAYVVPRHALRFVHGPLDFVQINAAVNESLIDRVVEHIDPRPGMRIADLFCGLGNFTLPLARGGARVDGFEFHAGQVERARANALANGLAGQCSFDVRDLSEAGACAGLCPNAFDALVLDPPRSGAEAAIAALDGGPAMIVYVSCNPTTLARDAATLVHDKGYALSSACVVDMFPHTLHAEALAVFVRA